MHLRRARFDSGQRVGHTQSNIIMGVNANPGAQFASGQRCDASDFAGQTPSIGIAQNDEIGSGLFGGAPGVQSIIGAIVVTIKAVLGVVDDKFSVVLQESDGVGDHGQVFIGGGSEHFFDVQQPGFSDDGDDRGVRFE